MNNSANFLLTYYKEPWSNNHVETNITNKVNQMHTQLYKAIFDSNLVPNSDIKMHVESIERGDYSLTDLLENARKFYFFDQYAHETMLIDHM